MNNNIPLIIKKNAGCQYIYFSIMFLGGTVIENETNVGITHLLEHLLLSMKADDNLSIFFDTEGVDIRGETAREYMNISGYFLSSQKKIFG